MTTIQKLGRALDPGRSDYRKRLEALRNKRMVFIFDECHRSQFGDNHQAIKEFFPKAQLFGFTGTPIFEENANYKRIEGDVHTLKTTRDLFQQSLHEYTITHAIEDRNVLRFHVDYYKPDGKNAPKPGETIAKRAIVDAILAKHDASTGGRKFNALFATASINEAIEYHDLFEKAQAEKQEADPDFVPLNIAAVFSPPANLFYSTGIPVCILVLKKGKKPDDVLFINAAQDFDKGKRQNQLSDAHIARIVGTYQERSNKERHSRRVPMKEIVEEKDYNLNISRYVSTAEDEVEIDLAATHAELVRIESDIREATARHNGFLKELGLPPLPWGGF